MAFLPSYLNNAKKKKIVKLAPGILSYNCITDNLLDPCSTKTTRIDLANVTALNKDQVLLVWLKRNILHLWKMKTMAEKYQNKYRIKSARIPHWDDGSKGAYFITICTQNREHFFGEMQLSRIGEIAERYWNEIPQHFPFVTLDAFVVMPNHIHGILAIDKINLRDMDGGDSNGERDARREAINRVSTGNTGNTGNTNNTEKTTTGGITGNKNPMLHKNISRTIRWYKGRCSFEIRKIHRDFHWQSRFHDHIIKNDVSYQRIKNYIINNPSNWDKDTFKNSKSNN